MSSYAVHENLSPPESGFDLTESEVNAVNRIVEQRAEDEMLEGTTAFLDWLHNNKRVLHDWQEYRVAMLSEDERDEIIEGL
jgi:hypothetical protein